MSSIKIKPSNPKLKVYDPATGLHIPAEGKEVSSSKYWRRLIKTGDVVAVVEKIFKPKKEDEKKQKINNNNPNMEE